jgi:hypothetical protein
MKHFVNEYITPVILATLNIAIPKIKFTLLSILSLSQYEKTVEVCTHTAGFVSSVLICVYLFMKIINNNTKGGIDD